MAQKQPKNAVTSDGELMIYGVVGDEWDGLDARSVINGIRALGDVETINIRINSGGGYVSEGMAIYSFLAQHKARKVVRIDGLAASMASVIAMAGDDIVIPPNAMLMIHNPWTVAYGDAEAFRKEADTLDAFKRSIVSVYAARTGKPDAEIAALMDAETWMTGNEAVDAGFATAVGDRVDAAALLRADLSLLNAKNIPDALRRDHGTRSALVASLHRAAPPAENPQENDMAEKPDDSVASKPADTATVDEARIRADAQKAERTRAAEIRKAVKAARLDETFADELVDNAVPLDEARARIINKLAEADTTVTRSQVRVTIGSDVVDRFRAGAQAALMTKAGLAKDDAGNEFRGLSLRELAREALETQNVNTRKMRPLDMVRMAMTHSSGDFVFILQNVAEKAMMRGYEEAAETFQAWTATGTLSDFKPAARIDLNTFPSLSAVPEGGEYSYATIGDRGETIQLATYGKLFTISRQAIINDDLSVFTRVPQRMGRAAIRTVGNLVYAILTANPAMSDGTALFHADHKNLGAGAAPSVASLDAGRVAMATQKDRSGNAVALNIRPKYMLVPVALEGTSTVLMASEFDPAKTQRVPNAVAGLAEIVSDARLDAASSASWYLAADPNVTDTVEVAYLDGVSTPVLEQMDGWKVDGIEFKVRMDAGVKALAWEGLFKNPGA